MSNNQFYRAWLGLFFLFCIVLACDPSDGTSPSSAQGFFDLKGYMEQEISRLGQEQPSVRKEIRLQDQSEVKTFDSLDYAKELAMFIKADINKVAWLDKYTVDTLWAEEEQQQIAGLVYSANSEGLKTQELKVDFDAEGAVREIYVKLGTESLVADVYQELTYQPDSGYRLLSEQSTAISSPNRIQVDVEWEE